jgi:signal transduction histidine kinase
MDGVLPAADETYQQIHAEAERLNRLVNDLQELSRVEAKATQMDIHPVDSAPPRPNSDQANAIPV